MIDYLYQPDSHFGKGREPRDLRVNRDRLSEETWQHMLAGTRCALQQSWAYGEAVVAQGHQVHRFAALGESGMLALAQVVERRLFGPLRITLLMRGPVWLRAEPSVDREQAFLQAIRRDLCGTVMFWTPDDRNAASKRHGFRRVVTGSSTIWLDLTQSRDLLRQALDGKCRNMLRRAEASSIDIQQCRRGPWIEWLINANEAHRKQAGYRGPSPDFISNLNSISQRRHEQIALIARDGDEPVAGIMVQLHGRSATYYVGCTSSRGRELRAHHLLLWRAIETLQGIGATSFDLVHRRKPQVCLQKLMHKQGASAPAYEPCECVGALGGVETDHAPGLARFKLGLGGEPTTLAGTYLIPPLFT